MQYDLLVSDIKYNPEKLSDLRACYEKHNDGEALKEKALQSLGFVNEDGFLLNGAVLFWMIIKTRKQKYSVLFSPVLTKEVKESSR